MALWRSGLTHRPLKATFTGSNPVRVTKMIIKPLTAFLFTKYIFILLNTSHLNFKI